MKRCKIVFNILTVIAYFYGILLCATLVLIPLGVYAIISAHRYAQFAEFSQYYLNTNKQNITKWIIFGCILYFPIGLIGLMCLKQLNIVGEPEVAEATVETAEQTDKPQTEKNEPVEVEIHTPQTEAEKAEKLEKLERFKQNGLITQEEFEQAKSELYGENKQ